MNSIKTTNQNLNAFCHESEYYPSNTTIEDEVLSVRKNGYDHPGRPGYLKGIDRLLVVCHPAVKQGLQPSTELAVLWRRKD